MPGASDAAVGDARLDDIRFVDAHHGWAVGDRGAIWNSDDGGRQWRLQPSGVTCSLGAVWFFDEHVGWAAGGFTHPYTHASTGVLLNTHDGGKTWANNAQIALPALRRLGFFDPRHGWAIGCPSAMYPTGVFLTDDGGRHWRPLPGSSSAGWLAGDFLGPRAGALAGRSGSLAVASGEEIETAQPDRLDLRSFVRLRLVPPTYGWLAGDGGLVRLTGDLGSTWRAPPGEVPKAAAEFDFSALAVRGPKCWIAGTPGTRVFHTADAGRTWQTFPTGSAVPLRRCGFSTISTAGQRAIWARFSPPTTAGEAGNDNGPAARRAALLGFFAEPDQVPLELIAHLADSEGYLTVIDLLGRHDIEIPARDNVAVADRLHEAVVRVGGCGAEAAWRFPLRQAGLQLSATKIVEAWNRVNDGHGAEALHAYLVRQIRMWRPEVIVTDDARTGQQHDEALFSLFSQAVLQAVGQAADANAFPSQTDDAGLAPWTVKKVFGAMPSGQRSPSDLVTTQFAPRLGRSLADAAAEPRGLVRSAFSIAPPTLGFRLLRNTATREQDRRDFFSGIEIAPGSPARRALSPASGEGLDVRQHIAQQRRHVQAILDRTERITGSADPLLAQIDELTRDLDDDSRGQILYQLADRYYHTGRWPLAAEAFQVLVERYPKHSLTPQAMLWLLHYHASAEAAWRVERGAGQKRLEQAVTLANQMERTQPEWFADPAVGFPLAAAYRGLGQARQAERIYQVQSHGGQRGDWPACAAGRTALGRIQRPRGQADVGLRESRDATAAGWRTRRSGVATDQVGRLAECAARRRRLARHGDVGLRRRLSVHCRPLPGDGGIGRCFQRNWPGGPSSRRRSLGLRSDRSAPRRRPRLYDVLPPGDRPARLDER